MYVNAFNLYLLFIYLEDILHTDLIYKIIDIKYFSYHVTLVLSQNFTYDFNRGRKWIYCVRLSSWKQVKYSSGRILIFMEGLKIPWGI